MNYIDVAENECLLIIVLGMMLISQMSENEVEVALSIGINTFDLADIYGDGQCEVLLGKVFKRRSNLRDQISLVSVSWFFYALQIFLDKSFLLWYSFR